jgi:hypothetical protein
MDQGDNKLLVYLGYFCYCDGTLGIVLGILLPIVGGLCFAVPAIGIVIGAVIIIIGVICMILGIVSCIGGFVCVSLGKGRRGGEGCSTASAEIHTDNA